MPDDRGSNLPKIGWQLRLYLVLRPILQPIMRRLVARRVSKGKEDPARAPEKLGHPGLARPECPLIWIHAVGLGEVLALRPLLLEMGRVRPDAHFLVTSTARSSGQVFNQNLPPRVLHQFLPLDGPKYVARFLDHWRPDLSIWSEQDLWPGAICDTARRSIPLAYINARISQDSFERRKKLKSGFRNLMEMFAYVAAQDEASASYLERLGALDVQVMPSLKPAAEPLSVDSGHLASLQQDLQGRRVWVLASSHPADEEVAIAAHKLILETDPTALLIIVPRAPERGSEICEVLAAEGMSSAQRSREAGIAAFHQAYVADTLGELGLWYRLAHVACIGGSFGNTQGHNPWEAIVLGCPVISGPNTANFAADYDLLETEGLSQRIVLGQGAEHRLSDAVVHVVQGNTAQKISALVSSAREDIRPLASKLLALVRP
ncbi:MAG: 3-deoxy-D-manno-octulosonic acid transferase [Shimia sp.]|uniref:3-deoxy-D-manno-octulosonic acid transferase n=1 Tax=Shimia sp. TaxID=1954381 RepID=UPI001B0E05F7|nr:glycosyltransferase N-terminal domain-containing protein [Shimia sp.]MBO6899468.1 3-deoxy-D-manno-octulosonic acid transferase [Shimia sp.]